MFPSILMIIDYWWLLMQLVLQASFAVTMVSVFPPLSGAMDALVDVLMAVMRGDAVSWPVIRLVVRYIWAVEVIRYSIWALIKGVFDYVGLICCYSHSIWISYVNYSNLYTACNTIPLFSLISELWWDAHGKNVGSSWDLFRRPFVH